MDNASNNVQQSNLDQSHSENTPLHKNILNEKGNFLLVVSIVLLLLNLVTLGTYFLVINNKQSGQSQNQNRLFDLNLLTGNKNVSRSQVKSATSSIFQPENLPSVNPKYIHPIKSNLPSMSKLKIWNNKVYWIQESELYEYDINTGSTRKLAESINTCLNVWDNKIVYISLKNGTNDIDVFDTNSYQNYEAIKQEFGHIHVLDCPSISQDKIVWTDNCEVYLLDLLTNVKKTIFQKPPYCTSDFNDSQIPQIWGNKVVWQQRPNKAGIQPLKIHAYNLSTNSLQTFSGYFYLAVIYKDKIAAIGSIDSPDSYEILLHDPDKENGWQQITNSNGKRVIGAIMAMNDNYIVFNSNAPDASLKSYLISYYILNGNFTKIRPYSLPDVYWADTWGNRVVWNEKQRDNTSTIYLYDPPENTSATAPKLSVSQVPSSQNQAITQTSPTPSLSLLSPSPIIVSPATKPQNLNVPLRSPTILDKVINLIRYFFGRK